MRIGIVGPGRAGKDEAAIYLARTYGLRYHSGTSYCARHVVFQVMRELGYEYADAEACWNDRHAHRSVWAEAIGQYNHRVGPRQFYAECLADQNFLTGIRWRNEFLEIRDLCDAWLYIHRPGKSDSTCQVLPIDCDHLINNDGTLADFHAKLVAFMESLRQAAA